MENLVTVLLPCYNSEDYIDQTVHSILSQSYKKFNLIAINDGSTDNTLNILQERAKKDSRISIYNKANEGIGKTRDFALSLVKTEYFCFVDSDDLLHADFLDKLLGSAITNISDVVDCNYVRQAGDSCCNIFTGLNNNPDIYIKELLSHRQSGVLWNKLFRTKFILDNSIKFISDVNMWEDLYFCVQVFSNNPKISHVDFFLYDYIVRNDGLVMTSSNDVRVKNQVDVVSLIESIDGISSKFIKQLNGSKLFCKEVYSANEKVFCNSKWSSIFPLSLKDIVLADIFLKVKLFALLSYFKVTFVSKTIFALRAYIHRMKGS